MATAAPPPAPITVEVIGREPLFEEVCSTDFLKFKFGGRGYQDQLYDSIAKTSALAGVSVEEVTFQFPDSTKPIKVVWVTHNFGFLGGSLGCAEGEKLTRAFEHGLTQRLPVCVQCRTGGARMQEGTSSLMQMAKVSVAVEALHKAGIPFISVLSDPTYGGVSASYAMQADVRIALSDARIGFAGPAVILNTMCEANQQRFDTQCPSDFQSADYVLQYGQIDMIQDLVPEESAADTQRRVENNVARIAANLLAGVSKTGRQLVTLEVPSPLEIAQADKETPFNYTRSRQMDRPQVQDIIAHVFDSFIELVGDGRVGKDACIRGGLASFKGQSVVVIGTFKGHTPATMQDSNYGMASPHGYRTAMRLMKLAERFHLPVVTLVDTVGAWPTFECERDGQSEAIATNLTVMAGLTVPIITLLVGEGGSGGALGIGMGNVVGMLSGGYFGVISPEGAASILGRYKDDAHKAQQFPLDCQALATAQCIYAYQLKELGVVDEIIWESATGESFNSFPVLRERIQHFIISTLATLSQMSSAEILNHRYNKFRQLGTFSLLDAEARTKAIETANANKTVAKRAPKVDTTPSNLIKFLSEEIITGTYSRYKNLCPSTVPTVSPTVPVVPPALKPAGWANAKKVLDRDGPEGLARWVKLQTRVLITDTTMRDAHQSLLATRVRTADLVPAAAIANELLKEAFSLECWGGATFDVCMRFLDECPWDRLRELRAACPDVLLQCLIRGANGVGYTSYPDNVVTEFVRLAALNGMDVFRIFDCFNIVENMKVSIEAVRAVGKVAEVCLCYTGNVLTSEIYNLDYYKSVAREAVAAGAHIIGIKDMAGLLKPLEAGPLLAAIREVTDLPIHFHTHATSSGSLATCFEMARHGCDVIDTCTASMADGTSQPSMNAFVAMLEGAHNDTGINYLTLEPYDMYWARVRDLYVPFESGMKSGSARVFEHQIPGGQYSNLIVQCQSMGLWSRWEEVLDAYRDVNKLFGDIVKVTPSSKCVGDLALYLVTRNMSTADVLDPAKSGSVDFPESVVGLMKGELGLPHRGFPQEVEDIILKGASKLTTRAGLVLPPVDFQKNIDALSTQFGVAITPEQAMSSLMYPKVFSDYMKRQATKGGVLIRYLPSLVYFYGVLPGNSFTMRIPASLLPGLLLPAAAAGAGSGSEVTVTVTLNRVSSLKEGKRTIVWSVNGQEQSFQVKDNSGKFVFEGPMAQPNNNKHMASPMPGVVEKMLVKEGQSVAAGEVLCTVSAMKMEVKVTAPFDAVVATVPAPASTRVVEGALLITLA